MLKLQYMVTILISCTVFFKYTNSDGWNMLQCSICIRADKHMECGKHEQGFLLNL